MEAIEQLKEEARKELNIDEIVDEIALELKECFQFQGNRLVNVAVMNSHKLFTLMQKLGLVEKIIPKVPTQQYYCPLTKKAIDLYQRLKEEDYYSK